MKKYGYIISGIVVLTLITAILINEFRGNYYKASPEEVHNFLGDGSVVVNPTTITIQKEPILFIHLTENTEDSSLIALNFKSITIKPNDLLKPENRKLYEDYSGIIIIKSNDLSLAANAWVLLTRMGYKNIKIWNENFSGSIKYSIQSDSIVRLN